MRKIPLSVKIALRLSDVSCSHCLVRRHNPQPRSVNSELGRKKAASVPAPSTSLAKKPTPLTAGAMLLTRPAMPLRARSTSLPRTAMPLRAQSTPLPAPATPLPPRNALLIPPAMPLSTRHCFAQKIAEHGSVTRSNVNFQNGCGSHPPSRVSFC